jgi:8-amino-7-oxononanoate synthase
MRAFDRFVSDGLAALEAEGLLRRSESTLAEQASAAAAALGRATIDAASNDYLGLAAGDVSRATFVESRVPSGSGASRLIHGTHPQHLALEAALAAWVRLDSALLFGSGYVANVGLMQALGGPGVVVISDAMNHASIIDGCRLARARVVIIPHLSVEDVERCLSENRHAAARIVVTESYFSMDGDGPDLGALRASCDRHDAALVVDEAHALGVFGAGGSGRCETAGVMPDVLVGTLGKAVGVQGAFVAGSTRLRELLWNRARSFVFSTAPSPWLAEMARFHVQHVSLADPKRAALSAHSARLRGALLELGVPVAPASFGPIVPVVVGDESRALSVVENLASEGILAQAIRPPTVPRGTARVRITVKASWPDDGADIVARALSKALAQ